MTRIDLLPDTAAGAPPVRRRWWTAAWLVATLVVLVGFAALPWEWSFIDDTGAVTTLHAQQALHGTAGGVFGSAGVYYRLDMHWGLFRPAWWLYAGLFYLLPVGAAHAARLLMLAVTVAGPLVALRRSTPVRAALVWMGAVVAANPSLYRGIWYLSLQELSGTCFVGLGLATRRPGLRLAAFVVAAWFKAPFAWLLIGYGALLLLRRTTRWWGAAFVALGAATLAIATDFARSGSYTTGLGYGADRLLTDARTAALELAPVAVVVVVGALALATRPQWPAGWWPADPTGPGLVLGGLGYLANLLPWQTGVHYAGPYVYLIGAGAVLWLAPAAAPTGRWRLAAPLAVAVVVGLVCLGTGARYVYRNAATTVGLRDCVLGLPDGSVVGYNRPEAWDRLNVIVRLHRPASHTHVSLVWNGTTAAGLRYYIWEPEYGPGTPALRTGPVVCHTPLATVYAVR